MAHDKLVYQWKNGVCLLCLTHWDPPNCGTTCHFLGKCWKTLSEQDLSKFFCARSHVQVHLKIVKRKTRPPSICQSAWENQVIALDIENLSTIGKALTNLFSCTNWTKKDWAQKEHKGFGKRVYINKMWRNSAINF